MLKLRCRSGFLVFPIMGMAVLFWENILIFRVLENIISHFFIINPDVNSLDYECGSSFFFSTKSVKQALVLMPHLIKCIYRKFIFKKLRLVAYILLVNKTIYTLAGVDFKRLILVDAGR